MTDKALRKTNAELLAALTTQAETIRRLEGEANDLSIMREREMLRAEAAEQEVARLTEALDVPKDYIIVSKARWDERGKVLQRAEAAEGRLEQRYATGYLVGQLAMRERAAKKAMEPLAPTTYAETYSTAISEAIRALEPEEPK